MMKQVGWNEILAQKAKFIGGQVKYNHLGDTYRGEISDIMEQGDCLLITLAWIAIWCDGLWRTHDGDIYSIEAVRSKPLEGQPGDGYNFTAFNFRNPKLYMKGHHANIPKERLAEMVTYPTPTLAAD